MNTCTYPGCDRPYCAKGYCQGHYDAQRHGYRMDRVGLTAADRFWLYTRKSDGCWEWVGAKWRTGYGSLRIGKMKVSAHRFAYELLVGPIPDGLDLDHRCHNRGCVNPAHLHPVTNRQNAENRCGANRNNRSSGVRGVTAKGDKWQAYFYRDRHRFNVGTYSTVGEAEAAVIAARRRAFTNSDIAEVQS